MILLLLIQQPFSLTKQPRTIMEEPTENEAKLMAQIDFLKRDVKELQENLRFHRCDIWDVEEALETLVTRYLISSLIVLGLVVSVVVMFIRK